MDFSFSKNRGKHIYSHIAIQYHEWGISSCFYKLPSTIFKEAFSEADENDQTPVISVND